MLSGGGEGARTRPCPEYITSRGRRGGQAGLLAIVRRAVPRPQGAEALSMPDGNKPPAVRGWHEEACPSGPGGWPSSCRGHTEQQGPLWGPSPVPRASGPIAASPGVPGRELEDRSCRLSRTPSSYKASFCTIFRRAGLMTIRGGCDDAGLLQSDPGAERAPSQLPGPRALGTPQ